ncbi:MAG TPA: TIGR03560 family F420-dependent LLM class oxidoreductase [Actinomycetota bacterium]|nr:TIGR03560 family F420-dependent LLM class oxidoreductase [Actinomycetota bacterium]
MRVCLMIEGQEGVSWDQWIALADACEEHGLEGLFRSDHYRSLDREPDLGTLDAWVTLGALADRTERIRLGTLVSPVTFRHPAVLARSAITVDRISGGRLEVGMGAGWHVGEHRAFGFPYPEDRERLDILEEQLEIVHRLWHGDDSPFEGRHYRLEGIRAMPRPVQQPHPPLILGGGGKGRSARLAARWADEYNTSFATPEQCRERRDRVARAWERQGRDPAELRFSVMTGIVLGADRDDLFRRAADHAERFGEGGEPAAYLEALRADAWVVGTVPEVVRWLHAYEEAGVYRVMLQHLPHEDLETVEMLVTEVAPAVA